MLLQPLQEGDQVVPQPFLLLQAGVLSPFLGQQLCQLMGAEVELLESGSEFGYALLLLAVLVLLGEGEVVLEESEGAAEDSAPSAFLDLLASLELLALGEELLHFLGLFGVVVFVVEEEGEEALDHPGARLDEGLVLGYRHLALHEGEKAILGEGREDEAGFSPPEHLHGLAGTSKSKAKSE